MRTELQTNVGAEARSGRSKRQNDAFMVQMMQKVVANGATDLVFKVTPATVATLVAGATNTRGVKIQLCDALGNVHNWFNGAITTAITKSSVGGTVTNVTTINLVDGEGFVSCAKAGTWLAADTNTVTASAQTILGCSVLAKTSVETIS